jgi:amidase
VDGDRLLARARALDALPASERERLPLWGSLIGVKDNHDTADLPTTYGSEIYADHRPAADAEVVARLRTAGALIAGKTKLTEFAWMHPTDTRNPLDPTRTPGGSSSGSAAAVAAGHVPVATGTQTAGSVNRPASYCGVVGYKGSFDWAPVAGVKPLGPSLDTIGLFARTVEEIERVAGLCAGHFSASLPVSEEQPGRIAFARTPLWDRMEPDAAAAIERVADDLEELELPVWFTDVVHAQSLIMSVEAAHALSPELSTHPELLSRELREALHRGTTCPPEAYQVAQRIRAERAPALVELLGGYDGVLTPSTTGEPPAGLEFTGDPVFSRAWTLIGAPCVSLPLAWTEGGLPVGLQLVGAPRSDWRLLAVARRVLKDLGR